MKPQVIEMKYYPTKYQKFFDRLVVEEQVDPNKLKLDDIVLIAEEYNVSAILSGGTIYIDYMREAMKYRYYIIRKEEINRGLYVKFLQSYKKIYSTDGYNVYEYHQ